MHDGADGRGKKGVTLLLDAETLKKLQALGPDWQDRLNEILLRELDEDEEL